MKYIYTFFFFLVFAANTATAKYVEFSVNMNNDSVSVNGIHVSGDFQTAAGFAGGNWNPASTKLTQIGTTGIYHIIVNIPSKKKYEYKYVNGDQFYEAEYVPEESRVRYLFNDNRWFYLDSLSNDTLRLPALIFSTNAPLTKKLLRFRVGMIGFTVSPNGVHVAGTHNSFDLLSNYMYSFDGKIYEYLTYIDTLIPDVEFRFINGNTIAQYETVPNPCNVFSNREIDFMKDTIMPAVCFNSCTVCFNGIVNSIHSKVLSVVPNPFHTSATVTFNNAFNNDITIFDARGKLVKAYKNIGDKIVIVKGELPPGFYYLATSHNEKIKLIIE